LRTRARKKTAISSAAEPTLLVDADACPVKEECIRVAERYGLAVLFVANQGFRLPREPYIQQMIVGGGFDEADDKVAELAGPGKVVVTADILLADRCLKEGATVLGHNGKPFTDDMIGTAIATRAIMNDLRGSGDQTTKGAPPFSKEDRSRFLQALDAALSKPARR
jgi:uncharacterized protein YaiI (UPF0178 family)